MLIAQQNGSEQISMLVGLQPQAIKQAQPGKPGTVANEVAGAQLDLTLARRAFVLQSNLSQRDVDIAQEELDAQKMRLEQLAALLDKKQILLHELQAMATRGSVSRYKILEMEADLSTLLVQQQDDRVHSCPIRAAARSGSGCAGEAANRPCSRICRGQSRPTRTTLIRIFALLLRLEPC